MPPSAAVQTFTTDLKVNTVALPLVFATVGEIRTLTPPPFAREWIDNTHLNSPDFYEEGRPGIKRTGEVSAEINYIPGAETALLAAFDSEEELGFRIDYPNDFSLSFQGFVIGFAPGAVATNGSLTATIRARVTGKPVIAATP